MIWALIAATILLIAVAGFAVHVIRPPKIDKPKKITYTDKSWQL